MFENMKVATKLALGFGVVVVLMLVIASVGVMRLAQLEDYLRAVGEERWPRADMANDVVKKSGRIGIELRSMMLANSREEAAAHKEAMMAMRGELGKIFDRLKDTLQNPKGKELLAAIIENRQRFVIGQDKVIALTEAGDSAAARAYLQNELFPVLKAYQASAEALADFQAQLLEESIANGKAAYDSALKLRKL